MTGLALLVGNGCEEEEIEDAEDPPINNFSKSFGQGHMYEGEIAEVIPRVDSGYSYDVYITGSNDGDADIISVFADNVQIGCYTTDVVRLGGNGWYVDQTSPTFRFTASSDIVSLAVRIDDADSYGTWPQTITGNKVTE